MEYTRTCITRREDNLKDACMKFYDAFKSLYPETDASGVSLGASLLKVREGMNYARDGVLGNATLHPIMIASKILSSMEQWYISIEWEALGILQGLKTLHHYCFAKEEYVITHYKPLLAMVNKDVAVLSPCLQCIILYIHQYSMYILYKPGPELYIADWLSHHNHA